jgi:hypothetical protein
MQLNNKNTHAIICISEITERIIFTECVNDLKQIGIENSVIKNFDKNVSCDASLTFGENESKLAYEFLSAMFSDFEISNAKNWKFETRTIRLIVDKKKLTPHLLAADAVGQLVSFVLNDTEIKQHTIDNATEEFIYIYLNFLLPEHKLIIENSDCIVIDLI